MASKWQGIDLQEVYADWAQSMKDFTLAQINHGIEVSKEQEHPPSLGEFMNLCRQYRPPQMLKISYKISYEQMEKNKAKIHELAEALRKRKTV